MCHRREIPFYCVNTDRNLEIMSTVFWWYNCFTLEFGFDSSVWTNETFLSISKPVHGKSSTCLALWIIPSCLQDILYVVNLWFSEWNNLTARFICISNNIQSLLLLITDNIRNFVISQSYWLTRLPFRRVIQLLKSVYFKFKLKLNYSLRNHVIASERKMIGIGYGPYINYRKLCNGVVFFIFWVCNY
jgi:hypothetical protein